MQPTPGEQIQFLKNLQRLLAEGRFTATYKYALLMSLADVSVERGDDSGKPLSIPTSLIAEKFIQYYWRQAMPYVPRRDTELGRVLQQNQGGQAEVVTVVEKARERHGRSLASFRDDPTKWRSLVKKVERVVCKMPLWKLQTVGRDDFDFLYANVREGSTIELRPGVAFCFRQFYGLIGDLVRGAWVRFVRGLNKNHEVLGTTVDLHEFLFGSERSALSALVPVLEDVQKRTCFYCRKTLTAEKLHVDHFIPWSRYPVDLGHNFVLAHDTCNSSKADHIAAARHLDRWVDRNAQYGGQMTDAFDEQGFIHELPTSLRIAEWTYRQVELANGLTWEKGRTMVDLPANWETQLESLLANVA